jgi:glycine/D-amino acid oxidase-like deaminating enzyme
MGEMDSPDIGTQHSDKTRERARFTIIGSGVIGLLTAQNLAKQGHDVIVVSKEGKPGDATSTTSTNAVGQFLPWVPQEHAGELLGGIALEEVAGFSREFYASLAESPHETGVMPIHNIELVRSDQPWPMGLSEVMAADERPLEQPVDFIEPDGNTITFNSVISFDTFSINTPKTVAYLADHAEQLGVQFQQRDITDEELDQLEGVIINAAGMGAYEFDDPSQIVKNFKGHTIILRPKEGYELPKQALSVEDLIMMPREDGTIVCGALYRENPDRPIPKKDEADELFRRLKHIFRESAHLVEGLDPDLLEHSDILLHSAGYRVEVQGGGIRVAPDKKNERLLHAYGFGGIGWSVGPHFAKQISDQAIGMYNNLKEKS